MFFFSYLWGRQTERQRDRGGERETDRFRGEYTYLYHPGRNFPDVLSVYLVSFSSTSLSTQWVGKSDSMVSKSHGISAAAGKVGSIVAVLIVYGINAGYKSTTRQGLVFLLFATFMALGALYSWAYLPDVQRVVHDSTPDGELKRRLETKSLEELGGGYPGAVAEGQVFGVRNKWAVMRDKVRFRVGKGRKHSDGNEAVMEGAIGGQYPLRGGNANHFQRGGGVVNVVNGTIELPAR